MELAVQQLADARVRPAERRADLLRCQSELPHDFQDRDVELGFDRLAPAFRR
jgi:hypothetical protein